MTERLKPLVVVVTAYNRHKVCTNLEPGAKIQYVSLKDTGLAHQARITRHDRAAERLTVSRDGATEVVSYDQVTGVTR